MNKNVYITCSTYELFVKEYMVTSTNILFYEPAHQQVRRQCFTLYIHRRVCTSSHTHFVLIVSFGVTIAKANQKLIRS